MLTPEIEQIKNKLPYDIVVVIFRHIAAFYDFSPFWKDYIYYINDDRLNDPKRWDDLKAFSQIVTDDIYKADKTTKSIFVLDYNPAVAVCLQAYMKARMLYSTRFFCLSFFHDDQTTSNISTEFDDKTVSNDYLMDVKFKIIESMTYFPYIQKYEIPIGFTIDEEYLGGLIKDLL